MRIEVCGKLRTAGALASALCVTSDTDVVVSGISTDSREVRHGDLFVALRGANTSGAEHVDEALMRGAVGVLGQELPPLPSGVPLVIRCDPIEALLHAAALHRRESRAFVVAISGSTGKTTAKEAVAAVLQKMGGVCRSEGNFNSSLGLPLSLLSFEERPTWVVELGVNHPGEMKPMAMAAYPDLAILTNVGTAHIGQYDDFYALLKEKAQLSAHLSDRGMLLIPAELPVSAFPCGSGRVRTVGHDRRADFYLENISMDENGITGDLVTPYRVITNLNWSVPGRIGISTLTTVGAACALAGCDDDNLRQGLLEAGQCTPRLHTFSADGRLLIDDSYNASPESVAGALEVLRFRAKGRPMVVVLGDMLELGKGTEALHRAIGASLLRAGVSMLFTYGNTAKAFAEGARMGGMTDDTVFTFGEGEEKELAAAICRYAPARAAVLFKGSGKMKMSRIVAAVRSEL